MNIKKEILKVCNSMVAFWDTFEREISAIPNEDEAEIICRWHNYFQEHSDVVTDLSMLKHDIDELEKSLFMDGKLQYKE